MKKIQLLILSSLLSGCVQNVGPQLADKSASKSSTSSTATSTDTSTVSSSASLLKISGVSITTASQSTATTTVFFDPAAATPTDVTVRSHCALNNTKPCVCTFEWTEVNATTGSTVPVTRHVQTALSNAQDNLVTCNAPSVFSTEIAEGTQILVGISATGANPDAGKFSVFSVVNGVRNSRGFVFTKNSRAIVGSFQDQQGRSFVNILRYSCYEQFKRGMDIKNRINRDIGTNPRTGENVPIVLGSQFCVAKIGGQPGAGCEALAQPDNSAQAYYYNLYIRGPDQGTINVENQRFRCPQIKEPLLANGGPYWPMDQQFALALNPTVDFPIGVEAYTKISIAGDPTSSNSGCFASGGAASSPSADSASLVRSCLGFAAKPNTDGTCPRLTSQTGLPMETFKLRRFIALYPPIFDTDGKLPDGLPQRTDTIYVLDRPVARPDGDLSKPSFTMRGPKPCPFAFFDHSGVTTPPAGQYIIPSRKGGMPTYRATNHSAWDGVNVDGIQFPNHDGTLGQGSGTTPSCSATIPLINETGTQVSLATVNALNPMLKNLYVRPIKSWAPHYEEDTDFQACAPQSGPVVVDPPLHFARDAASGNVSWCAEAYPTQNPRVGELDVPNASGNYPGMVLNFTSHVVKNSVSTSCLSKPPTAEIQALGARYPNTADGSGTKCLNNTPVSATIVPGAAYHPNNQQVDSYAIGGAAESTAAECTTDNGQANAGNNACLFCANQTCDRTTLESGSGFAKFPLLARAKPTEDAISSDSTYGCIISYDEGGAKSGKKSPTNGCCGAAVSVASGAAGAGVAHLEPGTTSTACQLPTY